MHDLSFIFVLTGLKKIF